MAVISPDSPVEEANRIFLENLMHALPVVENGNLVGIVTTHNLLSYYSGMIAGQKMLKKSGEQ